MMQYRLGAYALIFAITTFMGGAQASDPGVTSNRILFGQAAPLTGSAAPLGLGVRLGIEAAFKEVNAAGGINGRKLELVSKDDVYDPFRSIDVTRDILSNSNVFALIGPVGTATTVAARPLAAAAHVPVIGPYTGAKALRDPVDPNLINFRASYGQETETMVEHLTKDLGYTRIGIFYQDDAFGRAGLAGLNAALAKRSMSLVAEGAYERGTMAVKSAVANLYAANPEAVVMVGAPKQSAEFIRLAHKYGLRPTFINISFVGADALAKELGDDGEGVYVTQVVPLPTDTSIPLVSRYQAALKLQDAAAQPGFISLEGYMVGLMTVDALKSLGTAEPTRAALLKAFNGMDFHEIGGLIISLSEKDHQASDAVYLTRIGHDGQYRMIETMTR